MSKSGLNSTLQFIFPLILLSVKPGSLPASLSPLLLLGGFCDKPSPCSFSFNLKCLCSSGQLHRRLEFELQLWIQYKCTYHTQAGFKVTGWCLSARIHQFASSYPHSSSHTHTHTKTHSLMHARSHTRAHPYLQHSCTPKQTETTRIWLVIQRWAV